MRRATHRGKTIFELKARFPSNFISSCSWMYVLQQAHLKNISADKCSKSLGISDYRIRDEQMSVNSAYNDDFATFGAHRARLNLTSWPPGYRANKQREGFFSWLAVNLDHDMVITGIATQGYGNSSVQEWVESYIIYYEKGNDFRFFTKADGLSQKVSIIIA